MPSRSLGGANGASIYPATTSMTLGTYGLPLVGRYGLAHSLLAWARCELWCKDHSVPMLSPNWNHLRIGPYLRKEADKREYHRLFTFPHYITGLKRAWLIWRLPHIRADEIVSDRPLDPRVQQLVVFENSYAENFEQHFHEVVGRSEELHEALRKMTKKRFLPIEIYERHIAIHVRMGDFTVMVAEEELRGGITNARLPMKWYIAILQQIRAKLGNEVPAIVYSDGDSKALAELLDLPKVRRAPSKTAVSDLLSIAQASALISSRSGFSIWGCFLGGVPRLCFPTQRLVRALGDPVHMDLEPEVDFEQPIPVDWLSHVAHRLK